ncbi:hypothetical protein Ddc_13662 [Ditylenchus destructor]|nr:hypothetical protein Ddc_13662 [Ditylenchus destructor]
MPYVYNNGRYVEEPSTSHAEQLDESQFVDEDTKAASEISAAVMIAISVLLSVGLCTINPVLIASAFGPIVAYGCVFYVHNSNFDARRGNPLAGAYVFSAFYIFIGVGFFVYFINNCFQKWPSISPVFSIPLALLCLPFIAYQCYCVGLFYKDDIVLMPQVQVFNSSGQFGRANPEILILKVEAGRRLEKIFLRKGPLAIKKMR